MYIKRNGLILINHWRLIVHSFLISSLSLNCDSSFTLGGKTPVVNEYHALVKNDIGGINPIPIFENSNFQVHNPKYSPDGSKICYHFTPNASEIWIINVDGQNMKKLAINAGNPQFSPDGSQILYIKESEIWLMDLDGGNKINLETAECANPSFSPDGSRIVYEKDAQIWLMGITGENKVKLSGNLSSCYEPIFFQDGSKVLFVSYFNHQGDIYAVDILGINLRNLTNSVDSETHPLFSADGRKIIFVTNKYGGRKHYSMDFDGSNHNLYNKPLGTFSPDGSKVAYYIVNRDAPQPDQSILYISNIDGSGRTYIDNLGWGNQNGLCFSPDGSEIVYVKWIREE